MKKVLILLLCITVFLSCKNENKSEKEITTANSPEKTDKQNDGLTLLKGEFVFYNGAAVLQTHADIYGVLITDKMHELNKLAKPYKEAETDMVNIEIRGKITNKKDEKILWEHKVEIVEILNVSKLNPEENNVVKLGNK